MAIHGFLGGVISATAPSVTTAGASGIFTLEEQLQASAQNNWPGYQISRSVRLRSSASAYLTRTPASAGSLTTWTWSGWIKRGTLGASQAIFSSGTSNITLVHFQADNTLRIRNSTVEYVTTQVFRDPSAWYHIVLQWNTTNGTAANRVLLYVNGVQVTSFSTQTTASSSEQSEWNKAQANDIGRYAFNGTLYFDGYMTEINFIDGQALTPTSFGAFDAVTGVWNPIRYSGTYGTNGFYLNFSDNSSNTATTIGKDYSGNGNNWTPSANISVTTGTTYDSMVDVPIGYGGDTGVGGEVRGNYAVLNGVDKNASTTLTEANLSNYASGAAWQGARASIAINSGKWYIEGNITNHGTGYAIGFANSSWDLGQTAGNTNASGIYWDGSGTSYYWFTPTVTSAGFTPVNGNSFVMAIDMDAGKVWFGYRTSSTTWLGGGDPATGSTPTFTFTPNITLYPCLSTYNTTQRISINFGQRPFSTTAPSGYKALCTQNLPAPSIVNGANYMAASLYTGTGASQPVSNAVNSISFQPDLVWVKSRSAATDHKLTDVVRGVTKALISNTTGAETTDTNGLTAFGASGFTVGTDTVYNNSGATYVGWQWKGGGTGVSNTQGTITSTVSANTTAGFSVVAYTGNGVTSATVGHGLNVTPSFIITKNRDIGTAAYNWYSNHISLGAGQMEIDLTLNSINPATTFSNGGLAPASSWTDQVFSFVSGSSSANNVNNNTSKFIAYCFAPIAGYSAFGSYSGNNTTDGPFVYLGFRPRFLIIKSTSNGTDWVIIDTARNPYNLSSTALVSNSSNNEATIGTVNQIDILSNGFKPRNNTGYVNASQTYIYAAFAENPFNISRAR